MATQIIDIDCSSDLPKSLALASGRKAKANAIARRLVTPRGFLKEMLDDDPDYGYDLRGQLNADMTLAEIEAIDAEVELECLKEPWCLAANVSVDFSLSTNAALVTIELDDDQEGPWTLVLSIGELTAEIINAGTPQDTGGASQLVLQPVQIVTVAGPAGPPGPAGTGGGGTGAATIEDDDSGMHGTTTGTEELLWQGAVKDFDAIPTGTITVKILCWVRSTSGTATFRLYISNADGTVAGTLVLTFTTTSATLEMKEQTATLANPTGNRVFKVTGQSSGAGQDAVVKGIEVEAK